MPSSPLSPPSSPASPAADALEAASGLGPVGQQLHRTLQQALAPARLAIRDDSHLHAGHAGAREGGHFHVTIASERFRGLMPVARHRLIYDALGPLAPLGVHALSIDAQVPPT
jgi:BolA family transcriptional regulator, general stress-responsive regulator